MLNWQQKQLLTTFLWKGVIGPRFTVMSNISLPYHAPHSIADRLHVVQCQSFVMDGLVTVVPQAYCLLDTISAKNEKGFLQVTGPVNKMFLFNFILSHPVI